MRIAVVDDNAVRAAVIEEGLREFGMDDVALLVERKGLARRLEALAPDVILINLENPSRDELEELFGLSRALARPIAMFVDQSDEESMASAIDAGVSAYVVDGLAKHRLKPILDLAIRRFNAFSRLQRELAEARSALAERQTLDDAKRILMARRGISEPQAYALLRSHAMNSNRKIAEVAEALVTAEKMLGEPF